MFDILLFLLAAYGVLGVCMAFALSFFWIGPMDASAAHGSWGFRLVILPGLAVFWPLMLVRAWRARRDLYELPVPEKPVPPRALRSAHGYWIGLVFLLVIPVVILALRWRVGDFRDLKQAVVLPALEHSSEKGF